MPKLRESLALCAVVCGVCMLQAQPRYSSDIQPERLGRGVVCMRDGDSVAVSWRWLRDDDEGMAFNVYRNGRLLNAKPIRNATFCRFPDTKGDASYTVTAVVNGEERIDGGNVFSLSAAAKDYISIPLVKPDGGTTPDGRSFAYTANDASVGDVDGDGEYEIVLKWDPTNSHDNSHEGHTGPVIFDCYKLTGEQLWRINLGRNIRSGAHYNPFIVYDLDGDGRAEFVVKTADGTRDGAGQVIGDSTANWVTDGTIKKTIQGKGDARPARVVGRILDGPEFLTVFDGLTGKALATVDYIPPRGNVADWGDSYGNRSERYLAAVGYFDGQRPSVVMCRGYYTQSYLAAYDWDGKELRLKWLFDSTKHEGYSGQGNHNLRVADVDSDGCDEITYGSMAVDHDGTGLYTTRMGHGDAIHLMPFYADSASLQVWDVHENKRDGSDFRDASTGRVIFQIPSTDDVGRGMAADIDPTIPGVEMWSASQRGFFDTTGRHHYPEVWIPMNSAVWWDGDPQRELLDRNAVSKWDWTTGKVVTLKDFRAEGCVFNNSTKQNPCLSADIVGDWREEVVVRTDDSSELRVYSTVIPTDCRIPSLMTDIPYRISVATENVGYNQPPELGKHLK